MSVGSTNPLLTRLDDGVAVVKLNRPTRLNAQTRASIGAFRDALASIAADESVRVVILAGEGRGFCAGLDLAAWIEDGGLDAGVADQMRLQETFAGAVLDLRSLDRPVIAAVEGVAVGAGFALALAADVRIASEAASFHVGAVRIGLSAGECGISYHLPRLIGATRAFELMLTGRPVEADEAQRIGLVSSVVPAGQALDEAVRVAARIARHAPYAIKHTKQVMWANLDAPGLQQAIELENRTQVLALMTEDFGEAARAFVEKRAPVFTGR